MKRFTQIHMLTIYPPSNPNADDRGQPKTAIFGGVRRLRMSSQSIKRDARLSEPLAAVAGHRPGVRTRRIGTELEAHALAAGAEAKTAREIAKTIAAVFGKIDPDGLKATPPKVQLLQLAFISDAERARAKRWAERAAGGEALPKNLNTEVLAHADTSVDLALFGRMLAGDSQYNREAALQVAHAITTHGAEIEDDYFTAVDDLEAPDGTIKAGFMDDAGFGAGLYYLYACIDNVLLVENVGGARALASAGAAALVEALATGGPAGQRTGYAQNPRSAYIRVEAGDIQPRSLACAFAQPVTGTDQLRSSIDALRDACDKLNGCYGKQYETSETMNANQGAGSLESIKRFVESQVIRD